MNQSGLVSFCKNILRLKQYDVTQAINEILVLQSNSSIIIKNFSTLQCCTISENDTCSSFVYNQLFRCNNCIFDFFSPTQTPLSESGKHRISPVLFFTHVVDVAKMSSHLQEAGRHSLGNFHGISDDLRQEQHCQGLSPKEALHWQILGDESNLQ